jgi:hypothetical protein
MLLKCLCGTAGKVSGGEEVRAAAPAASRVQSSLAAEDAFAPGESLAALREQGALIDAQVGRLLTITELQLRRMDAKNARQMARVMQTLNEQSSHLACLQDALHEGLDRISALPQVDAEIEALMQQLQDDAATR